MEREEIFALAREYANEDISELYQIANQSRASSLSSDNEDHYGELEAVKIAGIMLGHSGLVDRVYELRTLKELEKARADETDLMDFKTAGVCLDYETIIEICNDNNVVFEKPTQEELAYLLRNAYLQRGVSIDNANTSVGSAYQRLFGRDFDDFSFGETRIPYSEIPKEYKNMVHKMILEDKLKAMGFELPEKNGNNGNGNGGEKGK